LQGFAFLHYVGVLIIWPIGLVRVLFGESPFVLLVIENLALAGLSTLIGVGELRWGRRY